MKKSLLIGVAWLGLAALATAQEISILATERGLAVNTSMGLGDGSFMIAPPGIVYQDIWKPIKPKVEVIDDQNLILSYANGAEIKVAIAGTKVTFAYSGMPAQATRIATGFSIAREAWQGSKYSFNGGPLEAFPEEDERRRLFEGKAKLLTLADPEGRGFSLASPELDFVLSNKGPEGWSQFSCAFSYVLADHPGATEFSLEFSPVSPP